MTMSGKAIALGLLALQCAGAAAQEPPGSATAAIRQALADDEAGQDIGSRRYVLGVKLAGDGEASHGFDVEKGETYLVIGACDEACGDIDVVVEDGAGNVLGNDETDGADPFVVFSPTKSGRVSVIVGMKECGEDVCEYGFGFYSLVQREAIRD
jgi:hypothetical protein